MGINRMVHSTHRLRSDYATCIRNWLRFFPKEQILICNYDDIQYHPKQLLQQILSFLFFNSGEEEGDTNTTHFVDSLSNDVIHKRVNVNSAATVDTAKEQQQRQVQQSQDQKNHQQHSNSNPSSMMILLKRRPKLRKKMIRYLEPFIHDF